MERISAEESPGEIRFRSVVGLLVGFSIGLLSAFFGNYYFAGLGLGVILAAFHLLLGGLATIFLGAGKANRRHGYEILLSGLIVLPFGCLFFFGECELAPPALAGEDKIELVQQLARPDGIDLTKPDAFGRLHNSAEIVDLRLENGNWTSFMTIIPFSHPKYRQLDAMAISGHGAGFYLTDKRFDGKPLEGREFFFDRDYMECDSYLLCRRPLRSAHFVLYLLDRESSRQFTDRGMVLLFLRVLGPDFNHHVLLSGGRI